MRKATDVVLFDHIEFDNGGFWYWDELWVDFKTCEAAVKDDLGPGHVGWRCITAPIPYFEFAGENHNVMVVFPKVPWWSRLFFGTDHFHAFQFRLKELGWRTFDRS